MADTAPHAVFLSYHTNDQAWVSAFAAALRSEGVPPWFDAHEIKAGERWQEVTERALRESETLVLVITPGSFDSPWTFFELGAAIAGRKRVIPVIKGEVNLGELPPLVRQFQFVREASPEDAARRVAEALPKAS